MQSTTADVKPHHLPHAMNILCSSSGNGRGTVDAISDSSTSSYLEQMQQSLLVCQACRVSRRRASADHFKRRQDVSSSLFASVQVLPTCLLRRQARRQGEAGHHVHVNVGDLEKGGRPAAQEVG